MKQIYDDLTGLLALIYDMRITLFCISYGLDNVDEKKIYSVIEIYKTLLYNAETKLQDVLQRMDHELKEEIITGIVN